MASAYAAALEFQSAPGVDAGGTKRTARSVRPPNSFNPPPALMPGETPVGKLDAESPAAEVSIRPRR